MSVRVTGYVTERPEEVEAPVADFELPVPRPRRELTRKRWIAIAILAPGIAILIYWRIAGSPNAPVSSPAVNAILVTLLVLSFLAGIPAALLSYAADRKAQRIREDNEVLLADPVTIVGSVTAVTYASHHGATIQVSYERAHGAQTATWWGQQSWSGPRPDDPVFIRAARDRPVILITYNREWADDLLRAAGHKIGGPDTVVP